MRRFGEAAEIKVGVIGYGGAFNMGRSHLNEMKRAGMTPVAVAEIDASRLKVAADEFGGIETYATVVTIGRNPKDEGWRFYQNIADHLVKREKLVITPEWSRRPIHILDLADRSIKKRSAVKAKYA